MKNFFDILGKIVVVIGGLCGIGLMIVQGFVENGVKIYILSCKVDVCNVVVEEFLKVGQCIFILMDFFIVEGCEVFVEKIGDCEEKIDILVNNVGVIWGVFIDDFFEKGWDKVMDINFKGFFFFIQCLLFFLCGVVSYDDFV